MQKFNFTSHLKYLQFLKSTDGFSLIEMMIASTLIGISILGLVAISANQIKLNKSMSETASYNEVRNLISQILAERLLCKTAIAPALPVPFDLNAALTTVQSAGAEISFQVPGGVIQKDSPIPSGDLTVQSFRINNAKPLRPDPTKPANTLWSGQLLLRVAQNGDVFGPRVLKERALGFVVLSITPGPPALESCYSSSASSSGVLGSCPPSTVMSGINNSGVECRAVTAPISPAVTPAFTYLHPGPGCSGVGCIAYDYGPCHDVGCRTNGSVCTGIGCCAGPACL